MSMEMVYEIAYVDGEEDDALLLERAQLLSVDGVLRLRKADGSETPFAGEDVATVIS